MRLVMSALLVAVSAAHAQPAKSQAPCAPLYGPTPPRWVIANGTATVCMTSQETSKESCFAFSPTAAPRPAVTPRKAARPNGAKVTGGKRVCIGTACKPVGKKLAAAIATPATTEWADTVTSPSATGDGKLVVTGRDAWVVATDTKLALVPPKEYEGANKAGLGSLEVVGNLLVATWFDCAGPCGRSVLVDATGANRGAWFGEGTVMQLDAKRIAVFSVEAENEVVVIDVASGTQTSRVPVDTGGITPASAAKLDNNNVVVAWQRETDWKLQHIATPSDQPASAGASYTIAACPR